LQKVKNPENPENPENRQFSAFFSLFFGVNHATERVFWAFFWPILQDFWASDFGGFFGVYVPFLT
jgi:hypothetical protein